MDATVSSKPSLLKTLPADLSAGLVVFLVALPLCLGVALASNVPLFAGILAGIVGGILVGILSGSHSSVSGPAAGLTAVIAAQLLALGTFEALLTAIVIAGAIQIVLGLLRAGSIAAFVPSAVINGLLAAIGLILILKQLPHLVGNDSNTEVNLAFFQSNGKNTFTELASIVVNREMEWSAIVIGFSSLFILFVWERVKRLKYSPIPGPLAAVAGGVGVNLLLKAVNGIGVPAAHMVKVPVAENVAAFLGFLQFPDLQALADPKVYVAAFTIGIVASLETLLNVEAVDKIDPQKRITPANRELFAQGVGNLVCGLIGGLPVTSVIVRSSVNINAGGKTKLATIVHGLLLLLCVGLLPTFLNQIPLASLAAVLIMTGAKLASVKVFKQHWKAGVSQFLPFVVTIGAILFTDLLKGVVIGMAFSILFILWSNLRRPVRRFVEKHIDREVLRIELPNQVSFLNRVAISKTLEEVPPGGHLLIDAHATDHIDADVLALIREYVEETAPVRGVEVSLLGLRDHYAQLEDRINYVDFATRETQERLAPNDVIAVLQEGNRRYREGAPLLRDLAKLREETAEKLHPLAAILTGASARTPIELIFDQGPGVIIGARASGNYAGVGVLGTLEYACERAGAKLLVVMGHTNNDIVRMAIESHPAVGLDTGERPANLETVLADIRQAADPEQARRWPDLDGAERHKLMDEVSQVHVRQTLRSILGRSPALAQLVAAGQVRAVGAMYDVRTGHVEFFE